MSTRVRNITGSSVTLPFPYRGILGPGLGTILSDDPLVFLAKIGGAFQVASVLDIGPTSEPGVAANDPSPSAAVPPYGTGSTPLPTLPNASLPAGSEIFNNDGGDSGDGAPQWVDKTGTGYVDADGNPT